METKTTKKIVREPTYCILCHKHDNSHPNQLFLTKKNTTDCGFEPGPHDIGACKSATVTPRGEMCKLT